MDRHSSQLATKLHFLCKLLSLAKAPRDVRYYPKSDRLLRRRKVTLCAISDQSAAQQNAW
jgi:hypothetical protein